MSERSPVALVWLAVLSLGLLAGVVGAVVFGLRLLRDRAATPAPSLVTEASDASDRPGPSSEDASPVVPDFRPEDAGLTAEAAYAEMREALSQADARRAACFVPKEKLRTLQEPEAVLGVLDSLSVDSTEVVRATLREQKAVLFVRATSQDITSADGTILPIDAVVRMALEDGHWTVVSQLWLVASPVEQDQQEALAWLDAPPPR